MKRKITITAPEQPAEINMSNDRLIEVYNLNIRIENKHSFINNTIMALKTELVKRNIISEDHEGPIETI